MTWMAGLDAALGYHLQVNHYPPFPKEMNPVAKKAIEIGVQALLDDDMEAFETLIDLPEGAEYRGGTQVTATAVIESMHLDPFIDEGVATA